MIKLLLMNSSWFETAQARLLTMRDLIRKERPLDRASKDDD
jgi:hypothetical protein